MPYNNPEKRRANNLKWKLNNPEKYKERIRKQCEHRKKYGWHKVREEAWKKQGIAITHKEYLKLLSDFDYKCAICHKHQDELTKQLAVDHNHITGEVRGLLCHWCNRCIGLANEDHQILASAAYYLRVGVLF